MSSPCLSLRSACVAGALYTSSPLDQDGGKGWGGEGEKKRREGARERGALLPGSRLGSLQVSLGRRQAWSRAPRDQLPARLARPEGAEPSHAGAGRVGRGLGAARARERREARSPGGGRALPAPLRLSPACARARARARARRAAAPLAGQGHHARSRVAWTSRLAAAGHAAGPRTRDKKRTAPKLVSRSPLSLWPSARARVCRARRTARSALVVLLPSGDCEAAGCLCVLPGEGGRAGARERGGAGRFGGGSGQGR